MFVILVRSDDVADVAVAIRLRLSAAGPEPTRFEQDLGTGIAHKLLIPGGLPILPNRIGDVRAYVLLLLAAKDIDDLTIRTNYLLGRGLRTGIGGLPGVEGAAPAHPGRFCSRGIERKKAIHQ